MVTNEDNFNTITDVRIVEAKERRMANEFLIEAREVLKKSGKGFVTIHFDNYKICDVVHQCKRNIKQ